MSLCKILLLGTYILLNVNIEIFKIVILFVVLLVWKLVASISEERKIRVFENMV